MIKQIDILVHPDFNQMNVPNLPLHELQLAVREKWEQRFNLLKDRNDAILIYFSILTLDEIEKRLEDPSAILDKIECEEIYRIKSLKETLGNRFILFEWFWPPEREIIRNKISSLGFNYIPEETKIYAYGEILEMCVTGWSIHIASSLRIPRSNIKLSREESLTNNDGNKIFNWRVYGGTGSL